MKNRHPNVLRDFFWPNPPPAVPGGPIPNDRVWIGRHAHTFGMRWLTPALGLCFAAAFLGQYEQDVLYLLLEGVAMGFTVVGLYFTGWSLAYRLHTRKR